MADELTKDEFLTEQQADGFLNIATLASQLCDTPTAMINFLDDEFQWTLFNVGWRNSKIPRQDSICQFTLQQDDLLYIPDTSRDDRLQKVQVVQDHPDIGFYAGIKVRDGFGNKVGVLCVIDTKPRKLTKKQKQALQILADEIRVRLELIRSNQQLIREKKLLEDVIQNLPGIFCLIDHSGVIRRWNRNLENITGYSREELESSGIENFLVYDDINTASKKLEEVFEHEHAKSEFTIISKNGKQIPILVSGFRHIIDNENFAVIIGIDITDEKQTLQLLSEKEKKLEKTLKEREVLLAEIHHRVKNNLAVVSGLFQIEIMNIEDEQSINVLSNSITRIKSVALIHEKLYASDDFRNISVASYVDELLKSIENKYQDGRDIRVRKEIDDTKLNINLAMPAGLLLNELITNAFKHAFPEKKGGIIDIYIQSHDDKITLMVADNGIGLSTEFDLENHSSVGFTLVNVLSSQLMAEYSFKTNPGTRFTFVFKNRDNKRGSGGNVLPL